MSFRTLVVAAASVAIPAFLTGCPDKGDPASEMSLSEAGQALDEAGSEAQASSAVNATIEISTNFTIGQAVEKAAAELKSFVESQLPCADIQLQNATLSITYGAKPGNCIYKGQSYSGKHTITVSKDEQGDVVVEHVWDNLKNQVVSVSGKATVTWNFQDPSRHVVHDLKWTRLFDGKTGEGTVDEIQKPLSGGVVEGISVDGDRTWTAKTGKWDLAINNVEVRWIDPIPQAGSYELTAPGGKKATLSFSRIDASTIEADLVTGKKTYKFIVDKTGKVTGENDSGA